MNTIHKFLLTAAALAPLPLYAQQQAPAAAPSFFAPASASAAARRAEALPALANIPADVEAAAVVNHISTYLSGDQARTCPIDSVAIGFSKNTGDSISNLITALGHAGAQPLQDMIAEEWTHNAKAEIKPMIRTAFSDADNERLCRKALAGAKLPPVYISCTSIPGREMNFVDFCEYVIDKFERQAEYGDEVKVVERGEDFIHVQLSIRPISDEYRQYCDWQDLALQDELAKRTFHLYFSCDRHKALWIIYENQADVRVPQSPESSVLNTDQWAAVDEHLNEDIMLAGAIGTDLLNGITSGLRSFTSAAQPAKNVFDGLAKSFRTGSNFNIVYSKAATGITQLVDMYGKSLPDATHPIFLQVWASGKGYHAELSSDARGFRYEPGKLVHADRAADPDTIFYFESTPLHAPASGDFDTLCTACEDIFNGFRASVKPQYRNELDRDMRNFNRIRPYIEGGLNGLRTVCGSLSGNTAIIVDNKARPDHIMLDGEYIPQPRIAIYSGVSDRKMFTTGWAELMSNAHYLMREARASDDELKMLPSVPAKRGNITMYSVNLPDSRNTELVNISLTDTAVAAGTSRELNRELLTAGSGTQEFEGAAFIFRVAPAATMLHNWDRNIGAYIVHDAAYTLDFLTGYVDYVSGTSTIKDGVHTLRIDVKLSPPARAATRPRGLFLPSAGGFP